ncbi:MAG: hypothetical protein KatS3mg024_2672 [Armatimonadota bacterium]|nr:MAG: hypothetical protein KatS3mg024_2672 [Armatimonadota bacterium]
MSSARAATFIITMLAVLSAAGCAGTDEPPDQVGTGADTARVRVEGMGADTAVQICPADVAVRVKTPVYPGAHEVEGSGKMMHEQDRQGCSYSIRYRTSDPFPQVRSWYEKKLGRRAVSASVAGIRAAVIASRREPDGSVESVLITQKNGARSVSITLNRFEPGVKR